MAFIRENLPEPMAYYEAQGLTMTGPRSSPWKTTRCVFHDGSDSMRIHKRGAFVCMSCGAKGGDILAYHQAAHGLDFIDAVKELGAWVEDPSKPQAPRRPAPLPPVLAISVLAYECNLAAIAAANVANGVQLTDQDRARLLTASGRINHILGAYA